LIGSAARATLCGCKRADPDSQKSSKSFGQTHPDQAEASTSPV
jgi:hypothetical protein